MATTHVPLKGGAYQSHSVIAAAQRCLNLYPETGPTRSTSDGESASNIGEPSVVAHYPTPGTRLLGTIGTGPIRGIRQCSTGGVYVVSGDTLYLVNVGDWSGTPLGTLTPGIRTPVSMADNGLDMVVVDGSPNGWAVTLADNTFSPIPNSNSVTPVTAGATAAVVAGTARYTTFIASHDGWITNVSVMLGTGYTGQMKCGLFAADHSVLTTARTLYNPVAGNNTFSFTTPISVANGTQYWVGFDSDTSGGTWSVETGATSGGSGGTAFADFPPDQPSPIPAAAVVCSIMVTNDVDGFFHGADRVDYLDTFFVFNKPNTPQFYISGSLAVTFDSQDYANKSAYSDLLMVSVVCKRLIYLVGERTTEIWYESGETFSTTAGQSASVSEATAVVAFQFAPMQSEVFVDHGTIAKYSPAVYDNYMFWLTRDRQGHGAVHAIAGYESKRISTFAIEQEIAGYDRLWDAIGFCYRLRGHAFYVLIFPHADKTWAYDIITGLWHEWGWIDTNGNEHRHRANCFCAVNDLGVVGDWQNGNLYALDHQLFTDNGRPIKRVRAFPHMLADGKRVFYRQFLADLETGNTSQAATITVPTGTWAAGFTALPMAGGTSGAVYAVSSDGGTVVGVVEASINACYWTAGADPISLGAGSGTAANAVSADGSVIVGVGLIPFRWTASTGAVSFGVAGDNVRGISSDASRIVGEMNNTTAVQACYWNATGTVRTPLGFLPGHDRSQARAVSADGSVIVGSSLSFSGGTTTQRAWRWTAGTGMVDLGVAAPATSSIGFGVSADGNIVVGQATGVTLYGFKWTAGTGMVLMGDPISHAPAISEDGGTIMVQTYYQPDPDTYPYNYLGYVTASGLTIPVPASINPAGLDSGVYPYDGCISGDGRLMAGFTRGTPPGPWVYSLGGGTTVAALNSNLISLRWSDDRGHSWGHPVSIQIGEAGEYRTSLQWQRLGMARDRVFEIYWDVPMRTALQGCWLDATPAQS